MGQSDKTWWKMIGERLLDSKRAFLLVYFPFDKNKDVILHPNYRRRWNKEYLDKLLLAMGLLPMIPEVEDRICIGLNKPIFALERIKRGIKP